MKKVTLSTRTLGKKARKEVLNLLPSAKFIKKFFVAEVGYVHFFKDVDLNILGKVFMEEGQAKLMIN
jgi:hypothetical protein